MSKDRRYTFGARVEERFLDLLEHAYAAYFNSENGKIEKITYCITLLDGIKWLIQIGWEAKSFSDGQYAVIGSKLEEIGKMLGGWKKNRAQ